MNIRTTKEPIIYILYVCINYCIILLCSHDKKEGNIIINYTSELFKLYIMCSKRKYNSINHLYYLYEYRYNRKKNI